MNNSNSNVQKRQKKKLRIILALAVIIVIITAIVFLILFINNPSDNSIPDDEFYRIEPTALNLLDDEGLYSASQYLDESKDKTADDEQKTTIELYQANVFYRAGFSQDALDLLKNIEIYNLTDIQKDKYYSVLKSICTDEESVLIDSFLCEAGGIKNE